MLEMQLHQRKGHRKKAWQSRDQCCSRFRSRFAPFEPAPFSGRVQEGRSYDRADPREEDRTGHHPYLTWGQVAPRILDPSIVPPPLCVYFPLFVAVLGPFAPAYCGEILASPGKSRVRVGEDVDIQGRRRTLLMKTLASRCMFLYG